MVAAWALLKARARQSSRGRKYREKTMAYLELCGPEKQGRLPWAVLNCFMRKLQTFPAFLLALILLPLPLAAASFAPRYYLGLEGGLLGSNGADVAQLLPASQSVRQVMGAFAAVRLGYQFGS